MVDCGTFRYVVVLFKHHSNHSNYGCVIFIAFFGILAVFAIYSEPRLLSKTYTQHECLVDDIEKLVIKA